MLFTLGNNYINDAPDTFKNKIDFFDRARKDSILEDLKEDEDTHM